MNLKKTPVKSIYVSTKNNPAVKFIFLFLCLFLLFDAGNKFMNSATLEGTKYYNPFISEHFNYIQGLRTLLIVISATIIKGLGHTVMYTDYQLLALNGIPCNINYGCLGLGVLSFWAAFIIAFPKPFKQKIKFMFLGLITIFLLNIVRIVSLTLLTIDMNGSRKFFDYQHDIFNYVVYAVLLTMIYFWINKQEQKPVLIPEI